MAGRWRRLGAGLVIALVLYANAAVILRPLAARLALPRAVRDRLVLPLPAAIHDALHIFGVFSSYETMNREVVVEGLTETVRGGAHHFEWRRLDVDDWFPARRGERHTRLYAHRNVGNLTPRTFVETQRLLAARLKARHLREHPELPLHGLRVRVVSWPRSLAGYEAERRPGGMEVVTWHAE